MRKASETDSKALVQPLVTIALPVYNGAATLAMAIRSILQQSFQDWELIILDDASTDHGLEVMRSFADPRIRLVAGEENIGLSARLNMAVGMSKGTYFARMDQDDISFHERIEMQLEFLQLHPEIDLLGTNIAVFDDLYSLQGKLSICEKHEDICAKPWGGFYLPHPTWMGRVNWFKAHRYLSLSDGAEDQNLLLRSYYDSRFACLNTVLLCYRQNKRPLMKTFRARLIFAKAALRTDVRSDIRFLKTRIIFTQLVKSCGDLLASTGMPGCERKLLMLQNGEEQTLTRLFDELRD